MTKDTLNQEPSGRPKRQPVGFRNRMTVDNKDPNFEYRIVNDQDDRIEAFKAGGYEVVDMRKHKFGDKRMDNNLTPDVGISVGGGTKAVLMRIPKEFYVEDQKEKQKRIDAIEQGMKTPAVEGSFGKIEISK